MNSVFDTIADELAERSYAIADQFLSQTEASAIAALEVFQKGVEHFRRAGIGQQRQHQINEAIRGDYIQWVNKSSASPGLATYLNRVESLMQHLNQTLFLSLKDYEIHMTVYPVGSYYKRHLDQFKKDDHRKLSIICYLNEGWKEEHGGQLRIYLPDGSLDVLPTAGRLVCFRSDLLEHEVLPATRERLSLTGWILDQIADLRHL
jgi:SM-20-related protein